MINIWSFNSERELQVILNELDEHNNSCWPNVVLMLDQRRRRWTNINLKKKLDHPHFNDYAIIPY